MIFAHYVFLLINDYQSWPIQLLLSFLLLHDIFFHHHFRYQARLIQVAAVFRCGRGLWPLLLVLTLLIAATVVDHWLSLVGLVVVGDKTEHTLVVQKNFRRQTLYNPVMLEGVQRRNARLGVPIQTTLKEVEEISVGTTKRMEQGLSVRHPYLAPRICYKNGFLSYWVKEIVFPCWLIQNVIWWNSSNFHY